MAHRGLPSLPSLVEHTVTRKLPDGFLVAFLVAFIAFIGCRTSGAAGFLVAFMAFIAFTALGMVKRNERAAEEK